MSLSRLSNEGARAWEAKAEVTGHGEPPSGAPKLICCSLLIASGHTRRFRSIQDTYTGRPVSHCDPPGQFFNKNFLPGHRPTNSRKWPNCEQLRRAECPVFGCDVDSNRHATGIARGGPFQSGCRGTQGNRSSVGRCLSLRSSKRNRRVCRCRRLLCHIGLPDLATSASGDSSNREARFPWLLRSQSQEAFARRPRGDGSNFDHWILRTSAV